MAAEGAPNAATVSWTTNDDGAAPEGFYVEVTGPDAFAKTVAVPAPATSIEVAGLKNGLTYEFRVTAATRNGSSAPSSWVEATPSTGMEGVVAGVIVEFESGSEKVEGETDVPGEDRIEGVDLVVGGKVADDAVLVELSEPVDIDTATRIADDLESDPQVAWAEPDQFFFTSAAPPSPDLAQTVTVPADSDYATSQWNLWDTYGVSVGDGAEAMTDAWAGATGDGINVAVIDTGITPHPDLDDQLVEGYDFVSNPDKLAAVRQANAPPVAFDGDYVDEVTFGALGRDANPADPGDWRGVTPVRDSSWHGTQMAGIIAAASNADGITGVAPNATIQPIRALSWRGGLLSDIAASITWASGGTIDGVPANANPSKVINMSFAVETMCPTALQDAIDGARDRGAILIAAAGNASDDAVKFAPGNCDGVITVAASNRDGQRADYSNYGATIDISAPGGDSASPIATTSNTGIQTPDQASIGSDFGTSAAAAHVSAAAAILASRNASLTPDQAYEQLTGKTFTKAFANDTCDTANPDYSCGTGILTLAQIQTVASGDQDHAMIFDGNGTTAGAYATSSSTAGLGNFVNYTVEAWFKLFPTTATTNLPIVDRAGDYGLVVNQGNLYWRVVGSNGVSAFVDSGFDVESNVWYHVALVRQGSSANLFVNGQAFVVSASVASGAATSTRSLVVGAQDFVVDGSVDRYFPGIVDEVRLYDDARTQSEIEADMHTYGPTNTDNLVAYYDFNEGPAGTTGTGTVYNRADGATSATNLRAVDGPTYTDVKQTTSNGNNTVVTFPRSYLTAAEGWRVPQGISSVSALLVAGGGGGGGRIGGGGGAGELRSVSSGAVTAGEVLPITVGVGGLGGSGGPTSPYVGSAGGNGGDTSALDITVNGGGGGAYQGTNPDVAGQDGGSGGGGSCFLAPGVSVKTGSGAGDDGGIGSSASGAACVAGGGGGAGGAGGDYSGQSGGSGGDGVASSITGSAVYYAGGGGGGVNASTSDQSSGTAGAGGVGGGGAGGAKTGSADGSNGLPNTGAGGGGGSNGIGTNTEVAGGDGADGGSGGSGVVIISYSTAATYGTDDLALTLNGTNQSATAADSAAFDLLTAFTVEAWVKPDGSCTNRSALVRRLGSYLFLCQGGTWRYGLQGSSYNEYDTGIAVQADAWQHVAFTRASSSNEVLFYFNGSLAYTGSTGAVGTGSIADSSAGLEVGVESAGAFFDGTIDEVRLFTVDRSASEIATDMKTYGPVTTTGLTAYYDFNEGVAGTSGSETVLNRAAGAASASDLTTDNSPTYADVKVETTAGDNTVVTFPRSYLTAAGGWRVPEGVVNADALVVGGGGGGGFDGGGGGGGGGVKAYTSDAPLTAGTIAAVVVGQGGRGAIGYVNGSSCTSSPGTPILGCSGGTGGDSTLASTTVAGGGGGGGVDANGGSSRLTNTFGGGGGGGGHQNAATSINAGGNGQSNGGSVPASASNDFGAGGGGGRADAAGSNGGSTSGSGAGGTGTTSSLSGTSLMYGGGGGGGTHLASETAPAVDGAGKGGNRTVAGTSGTANQGGGGGGAGNASQQAGVSAGHGGSGVVIVSYTTASVDEACTPEETSYYDAGDDETYRVVAFKDTGSCRWTVPTGVTSVDYLVVGGGGGGGARHGGGGGAGGMLDDLAEGVTPGLDMTVTVGGGGSGGPGSSPAVSGSLGSPGENSVIAGGGLSATVIAIGGGYGAWGVGGNGGSGGGGGGPASGGSGEVGQGNDGGTGDGSSCGAGSWCGGGGGGAGGAGANASGQGGNGGAGDSVAWIDSAVASRLGIGDDSLGSVYFAGGGGGGVGTGGTVGVGGVGGGGSGSAGLVVGQSAQANTGGGGGGSGLGSSGQEAGGNGGSGVVVLRYVQPANTACTPLTYPAGDYTVVEFQGAGVCNWTVPGGVSETDVLAVGGGGGGGAWVGGGGGGGGVTFESEVTVTPGANVEVTVGAGGAGAVYGDGTWKTSDASSGGSSSFGSAVSVSGGGHGASWTGVNGQAVGNGGSGGGGSGSLGYLGGTGTADQGSDGGNGLSSSPQPHPAGGGGGAGLGSSGSGQDASGTQAGAGGAGRQSTITGAIVYYGGGGGGGVHGLSGPTGSGTVGVGGVGGGGGGGGVASGVTCDPCVALSGTDGLGGGGGGSGGPQTGTAGTSAASTGGDGGDGVVIVRYYTQTMSITAGNNQTATGGSAVATNPQVRVIDADGNGVDGVSVAFAVASGGGSVGSASVTTSGGGYAATTWTLGSTPLATNTITATADGVGGSPITFTATTTGVICDIGFDELDFDYSTAVNKVGDGKSVGNKVLFPGVATKTCNGVSTTIDALVTTSALVNSTITRYESGARAGGEDSYFQVDTSVTSSGGYAEFTFDFYESGTYGTTNERVILQNVNVTGIDIDASQFNTFTGFDSFTVASNTRLTTVPSPITTFPADAQFVGPSGSATNDPRDQVVTTYGEVDTFTVRVGKNGTSSTNYFGFAFKELGWGSTTPVTTGTEYTISYNANAADSGSAPSSQTGGVGEVFQTRSNTGSMVKTGYTFAGWNTAADGSGTSYVAGANISMPVNGVTLYAKWTAETYTLTYSANGGSGAPTAATGGYGTSVTVPAVGSLSRSGYDFAGWNTAADGSGTSYVNPATYTLTGNATLYAQWTASTITISYDNNGGTGSPSSQSATAGSSTTLSATQPTRTGYTFTGWNTASGGGGTSYASGATITAPSSNTTLYAQWTINTYTVTYNLNGGAGTAPASQTADYNASITTRANTGTRTGYTFNGWNTAADGSGTDVSASSSYTVLTDTTLYAKWSAITYTLAYDENTAGCSSGTTGSGPGDQTGIINSSQTVATIATFECTGFTFNGWNTASNGSGSGYAAGETFLMPVGGDTLYAQWVANNFDLIYNANGGTGAPAAGEYGTGTTATVASALPTRTGYTFSNWYTTASGTGGTAYDPSDTFTMPATDVFLYAQWTVRSYTVSYDANGGSGAPGDQSVNYQATATVSATVPTRSGYTFTGWNTVSGGSGTGYASSGTFVMPAANVTLYAQWSANSYNLTYNVNGGTSPAPSAQTAVTDATISVTSTTPTRSGYTFTGWNTAANGSGTDYAAGASFTMPAGGDELFAQWSANTYTVSYNANGGSGAPSSTSAETDSTVTVSSTVPTRDGYTFTGWNTASGGSGTAQASSSTFLMPASNVTLYAQWSADPYVVSYDANGGSGAPANQVQVTDSTVTVSSTTPTRTGYTLASWNTESNGTGTGYAVGATFTMPAENVTLYAIWSPNTYVVAYNANGGTGAPSTTASYTGATFSVSSTEPTRSNYTFAGWNTYSDGSGTTYAASGSFTMPASNVTLYAQWTPVPYTLSYNANGGSGAPASASVNYAATATVSATVPTRTGYWFNGWNTSAAGTGTSYPSSTTFTMLGDVTLYAQWVSNIYDLVYNANGGTGGAGAATYGTGTTVTVSTDTPTRTGYTFSEWYTNASGTGGSGYDPTAAAPANQFSMPASNTTLYAQWTAVDYTVTYNANSGSGTVPDTQTANYLDSVTVESPSLLSRSGYTFIGWNTNSGGTGTAYAPGGSLLMPASNVTLYAQWFADTNAVIYDLNGGSDGPVSTFATTTSTVTVSSIIPTRSGYTFGGWTKSTGGTVAAGGTFTMPPGSITLTAIWTANSYTVSYNANGGSGAPSGGSYSTDSTVTVSSSVPTRSRFTFNGWNTAADGSGTTYATGGTFTMPASNVTLYAQWNYTPGTCSVSFNANGGSGSAPTITAPCFTWVSADSGSGLSHQDATLTGWNTSPTGNGSGYGLGAPLYLTSDNTLFAQWRFSNVDPEQGDTPMGDGGDDPTKPREILVPVVVTSGPDEPVVVDPFTTDPPDGEEWNTKSVRIVDPKNGKLKTRVVTKEGTWTVDTNTGEVAFFPHEGFVGTAEVEFRVLTNTRLAYRSTVTVTIDPNMRPGLRKLSTTVYFASMSPDLDREDRMKLRTLVRKVNARGTEVKATVVGFVQPVGGVFNDFTLSADRAKNTATYLKELGVKSITTAEGLGRADEPGWKARRATATIWYSVS